MEVYYEGVLNFDPELLEELTFRCGPLKRSQRIIIPAIILFLALALLAFFAKVLGLAAFSVVCAFLLYAEYKFIYYYQKRKFRSSFQTLAFKNTPLFPVIFCNDGIFPSQKLEKSSPAIDYLHIKKIMRDQDMIILFCNQYLFFPLEAQSLIPDDLDGWLQFMYDHNPKIKFARF